MNPSGSNAVRSTRLIEFLGLRRSIVGLLGMVVLVGMGEHMAEQFLPSYLVALGGGFISVGLLDAMDDLLGALLWSISPRANLLAAFAFGTGGTIWFAWRGRDLPLGALTRTATPGLGPGERP